MQNFDPILETRVIKTLLDRKEPRLLTHLSLEWFGFPNTREIWQRVTTLRNNSKPIPSSETLGGDPVLSEDSRTLLSGDVNPFESHEIEQAMDQLNHSRKGRVLLTMVQKVTDALKEQHGKPDSAKVDVERALAQLQEQEIDDETLTYGNDEESVAKTYEFYEKIMDANVQDIMVPTGFKTIDRLQGGMARGGVYTIGAPSGGGKSTLANQIAINAYFAGFSVGYNSFEMDREKCMMRTQSNISRIPHQKLKLRNLSPEERARSDKAMMKFLQHGQQKGVRLDYLCPTRDINMPQLFNIIDPLNHDVEVIDYINLMASINPKEGLWWNIGEGFRQAKRFAERTKRVVIMLVQIDEETGDIKYAKSIKHHSDGVWLWKYGAAEKESKMVELDQTKMRDFEPTKFPLQTQFEFSAFSESFGAGAPSAPAQPQPAKPMSFD